MEEFNLDINEPINIKFNNDEPKKVNFSSGMEFLMNDKKRNNNNSININLNDVDDLEAELNNLSGIGGGSYSSNSGGETKKLNSFSLNEPLGDFNEPKSGGFGLGDASAENTPKTWDGFTKVNEMPTSTFYTSNNLTDREKKRKQRLMVKKIDEWAEKGFIKSDKRYTMDSSYEEVEDEYETALEDKRKRDSIKVQGNWLVNFIHTIEYLNAFADPFGLNLDSWGEQINDDLDSYDEIFGELYEKYKGGKIAPEISLILRIAMSGCIINFTNKALSTATPGFNDVIKQSPDLMRMFTEATVKSMSNQSPGFNMAANMASNKQYISEEVNKTYGAPPAPIETKNQAPPQRPVAPMQYTTSTANVRPDISMVRGAMLNEQGVNMSNNYGELNKQERTSIVQPPSVRTEMKGPQMNDIDNLLSGLKTRPTTFQSQPPPTPQQQPNITYQQSDVDGGDDSLISISSLKDIENTNFPKKNGRKKKSDKNTISLDI
jgi:hypothetical protein